MKPLFNLLIAILLSGTLVATPRCERLSIYDAGDLLGNFTKDLTSHTWRSNLLGSPATLYFNDDGILLVLPEAPGKIGSYMWSLSHSCCTAAFLTIADASTDQSFMLSPTCSGISALSDTGENALNVSPEGHLPHAQHAFLREQLQGTWYYSGAKVRKGHPSGFALSLHGDGSFVLKTGPDMYHSAHEGVWQLSPDGEYLLLYSHLYLGDTKRYVAEAISLKSADYEDLVIDARYLPRALREHAGRQNLFLSKSQA